MRRGIARLVGACALCWSIALLQACATPRSPSKPSESGVAPGASPTPIVVRVRSERIGSRYVYLTRRRKDNSEAYMLRSDENVAESAGEGTGRSEFVNPHIIFTGREGQKLIADAPHAVILVKERNLLMDGGVHARTSDGMTVRSDTLTYNEATDRLHGSGRVVVTTPRGERLTGDRIDADLRLSQMRIFHDRR